MRIISGKLKGRKLTGLKGKQIRPTSDRIREAVFNILSDVVFGANVLELFAGTGAQSIEALSRGARSAVLIDNSKTSLSVIQQNIKVCHCELQAQVIRWNILYNLNCLKRKIPSFNLVFLDPPYNQGAILPTMRHLKESNSVCKDAIIVVEHHSNERIPEDLNAFELTDERSYGKTLVSFLKYMI